MSVFSNPEQLKRIQEILTKYIRLPFSAETIPGAVMESVLANVRNAQVLKTYDFVDVICQEKKCGWQVKSTKESTPVTWKRAKIPNGPALIKGSKKSSAGLQKLGNAIIEFCNEHALESLKSYDLDKIGYARLIIHENQMITYFERLLINKANTRLFDPQDFEWHWSTPKKTTKKEQLPALHGYHRHTKRKWWAWHGLGENQLHFTGEKTWWPSNGSHSVSFSFPAESDKLSLESFINLLATLKTPS